MPEPTMNRAALSIASIPLGVALFLALNVLAGAWLTGARIDLTEQGLYTLIPGSRQVARGGDEPIRLTLYYSRRLATAIPQLRTHAQRAREMLDEFSRASRGRIVLTVVDPEPFSEAEETAVRAGLTGVPVSATGERAYLGIVGVNSTDGMEVLPFLDPGNEALLEYDVARMIHVLDHPRRPVIGLLSSLPLTGSPPDPMLRTPPSAPWAIMAQLRGLFDVRPLDPAAGAIDPDIDVLMIVHPKPLPRDTLYAIDQYVLRGGRAVVFVDPLSEIEQVPAAPDDMLARARVPRASDLRPLLDAWGVEMIPGKVAADRDLGIPRDSGSSQRPGVVDYIAWLSLRDGAINRDDPVTARVSRVNVTSAGALRALGGATTTITPLLTTTERSMLLDEQPLRFIPDYWGLLDAFVPSGQKLVLAARISGPASSAYPAGPPRDEPPDMGLDFDLDDDDALWESLEAPGGARQPAPEGPPPEPAADDSPPHLETSAGSINVVVFADADILADALWLQEQRLGNIRLGYRKLADNGDLVINVLDNLAGSDALIAIRARGTYARPFDRVQEIRASAEARFKAEEQAAQARIRQTQDRLNELQRARPDAGSAMVLSPEQQAELDRLEQDLVTARKDLRNVQLSMRKDIERLGTRLFALNATLVPALTALAAVTLGAYRAQRRRADRRAAGGQD
jgi:ABC-type uncharacterized transport system involved in gliding motility auxiliary subunit